MLLIFAFVFGVLLEITQKIKLIITALMLSTVHPF